MPTHLNTPKDDCKYQTHNVCFCHLSLALHGVDVIDLNVGHQFRILTIAALFLNVCGIDKLRFESISISSKGTIPFTVLCSELAVGSHVYFGDVSTVSKRSLRI
jgi:hypothetical protein